MRTLAIDTSSEACSVALFDGDRLVDAAHQIIGRGHAEQLVPMIAALDGGGRAARILVGCGPGSFTGVRVGVAAARALALGWQAEIRGFNSLALVAAGAEAEGPLLVVMDGGHGEWLIQPFGSDGVPDDDYRSVSPAVAGRAIEACVVGNRANAYAAGHDAKTARDSLPDARHALRMAPDQANWLPRPLYARAPDAAVRA